MANTWLTRLGFVALGLIVQRTPEVAWSLQPTSREMTCRVVAVDLNKKTFRCRREGTAGQDVVEVRWSHLTSAFAGSRQATPEELPVGVLIDLRYSAPLLLKELVAHRIVWQQPASEIQELPMRETPRRTK